MSKAKATENEVVIDVDNAIDHAKNRPSTIKLKTVALYHKSGVGAKAKVKHHAGAVNARMGEDGVVELLAGNVPFIAETFKGKAPKAGSGLLMLYGIRDTLDETSRLRALARSSGLHFADAEIEVEIGYMEPKLVNREMLKAYGTNMQFANVRRMMVDLQMDIAQAFSSYADIDDAERPTRVSEIARFPHFFDRLFEEDRDMQNLSVLGIPLLDDPRFSEKMRQVAYVRPNAKVVAIRQGATDARILLPSWMTNVKV